MDAMPGIAMRGMPCVGCHARDAMCDTAADHRRDNASNSIARKLARGSGSKRLVMNYGERIRALIQSEGVQCCALQGDRQRAAPAARRDQLEWSVCPSDLRTQVAGKRARRVEERVDPLAQIVQTGRGFFWHRGIDDCGLRSELAPRCDRLGRGASRTPPAPGQEDGKG